MLCDIRRCTSSPPIRKLLPYGLRTPLLRVHHGEQKPRAYVGVTGFLMARVLRHRAGEGGAFTRKYRVHRLVYYHSFQNVGDAIARETEIKKWRREKKVALIHADNPTWEDLSDGWYARE